MAKPGQNTQKSLVALKKELSADTIVLVIAVLYIIGPLIHISKLLEDKKDYFAYYSYMPHWLMLSRYAFSKTYNISLGR